MKTTALKLALGLAVLALGVMAPVHVEANSGTNSSVRIAFSDAWCEQVPGTCWYHQSATCHIIPDPVEQDHCDAADTGCDPS